MAAIFPPLTRDVFSGAVDQGNGDVSFALWAPGKKSVHVIGDFNGWNRAADRLLKQDNDLWVIRKKLKPGRYRYQFLIDGELVIVDPYARAVEQPSRDDAPYGVVEVGKPAFEWKHDDWQRPLFSDLIIYELHIADFTAEGTFRAATDRLDYLAGLGINAVELLPVTQGDSEEDWGYRPVNYFAARCRYGTADDLKQLVDQAHARGIAVILDVVFSHSSDQHPFNRMYPYDRSPWYGEGIGGPNEFGLPTFDHRRDVVRAFLRDVQNYWLGEFHVDGFRYDYAINIGVEGDKGLPFLARQARIALPAVYLIGEYLPEDPKRVGAAELDAAWHVRSCYALKALVMQGEYKIYDGRNFDKTIKAFDPRNEDYQKASRMINYIESHDEARLVHELIDMGVPPDPSRRKLALAASVLFTAPGIPQMYHGQEFGETAHLIKNERNPLRWELLSTEGGQGLFNHYQRLCRLRRKHPALRNEGYSLDASHNDEKWMVFHRWNEAGDVVVVAANFSDEPRTIPVPFPETGLWREVFRDEVHDVKQDKLDYGLEPNTAAIFVRE